MIEGQETVEKQENGDSFTKFIMVGVQTLSLAAICFVSATLWNLKADVQDTRNDLKWILGNIQRIDRLADSAVELRERITRAEDRITTLGNRLEGQRAFILDVVKDIHDGVQRNGNGQDDQQKSSRN